ncbi:MAG: DUF6430 domain-containing protein [Corynebacterium sp.]|nr:DUF6430 domain-containing protein [Corynebacterium sp.]
MLHRYWNRRYLKGLIRYTLEALGEETVLFGVLLPFWPDLLKNKWWFFIAALVIAVLWAIFSMRRKMPEQDFPESITIKLVEGDLFEQNASALVGMTTTFDTDFDIISQNSVQGNFLKQIYGGSQSQLDNELVSALKNSQVVDTIEKPGKKDIYQLGTVAVLSGKGTIKYYYVAYTSMDVENRAKGSICGILESLCKVWEAVDRHNNGEPICVPLLGQGQSRIPELTPEVSVRIIALSFLIYARRKRFSKELRIVIHPEEIHKINFADFQSFLSSVA